MLLKEFKKYQLINKKDNLGIKRQNVPVIIDVLFAKDIISQG
jgi:hypothetical protein